jgi:hypothetical protein
VVVVVHPSNCRVSALEEPLSAAERQRVEKDPGFVDQISGHQLRDQYAAAKHGDLSTPPAFSSPTAPSRVPLVVRCRTR